jgi:secreted PhoX family phosphatase
MQMRKRLLAAGLALLLVGGAAGMAAAGFLDFGVTRDAFLARSSWLLYGVKRPLAESATDSAAPDEAAADARSMARFAAGLKVRVVTQGIAAPNIDMMALWPDAWHPTTIIACNEQGPADPGLQAIDIATGAATTLLTGTSSCDPAQTTPWGTILFGEEAGGGAQGGQMLELIDPLDVEGVTFDRTTGTFSGGVGADHFAVRAAMGRNSFEGVGLLPNGVAYYGDENRPSTGTPGGAYFKFIPTSLRDPNAGPISSLDESPLASGSVFGLRLGLRSGATDFGQGTNLGLGTWVPIPSAPEPDLRQATADLKLTGFYRPEDLSLDQEALHGGDVAWCGNNTGNEATDHLWGEAVCLTDGTVDQAATNGAAPEMSLFVAGNPEFAMMDNIAYQPGRGNWLIMEDGDGPAAFGRNNDVWDCLPDGGDDDVQADGCVRVATLRDLVGDGEGAEWTGGVFDATGTRFFISIQHNVTGFGVVLEVTGWAHSFGSHHRPTLGR